MWTFDPIYKSKIWGGDRLAELKGTVNGMSGIGESYELSALPGEESKVCAGPDAGLTLTDLVKKYDKYLLGEKNFSRFGHRFPLLVKFIDAFDDLSVQVHPDSDTVERLGEGNAKSEMWYVMETEPGSVLANGFNRALDKGEYLHLLEGNRIEDALNFFPVHKGDVFYIPAGRIHALGGGTLVCEIQQSSDTTYRIYDYNRRDKNGNKRELDTEHALEALNFADTAGKPVEYELKEDFPVNLLSTPYFTINLWHIEHSFIRDFREWDTFVIFVATYGEARITSENEGITLRRGMTLLIPASARRVGIEPVGKFSFLETYIK